MDIKQYHSDLLKLIEKSNELIKQSKELLKKSEMLRKSLNTKR